MSSDNIIQVLSVDSSSEGQQALRTSLAGASGLAIVAEASSGAEAMQQLAERKIDVALLDLSIIGSDGVELTREIRKSHPNVRVVIRTSCDSPEDIFTAMDAGADGYILKESQPRALANAITSVKLGTVWLDPGIARQVLDVITMPSTSAKTTVRTLPTGLMPIPLLPDEKSLLNEVAGSDCVDGVCMVNPDFVKRLRRFSNLD